MPVSAANGEDPIEDAFDFSNIKGPVLEGPGMTDKEVDEAIEKLKLHPAFMTEFDPTKPMSDATEALMALKYQNDAEDLTDKADTYKDEGNKLFKHAKYRWASINYTEGINIKCADKTLNAQLYLNRATAQFKLQNYRSSLIDAILATKFAPTNIKAFFRAAESCYKVNKFAKALEWCENGLKLEGDVSHLQKLKDEIVEKRKLADRDARKQAIAEKRKAAVTSALKEAVKKRGVRLENNSLQLESVEGRLGGKATVQLHDDGDLTWPVLLFYPEHGTTDFIERFGETQTFGDHLVHLFAERAGWDVNGSYTAQSVTCYFEDGPFDTLYEVPATLTLAEAISSSHYLVRGGTPSFVLLVRDSAFAHSFLPKYTVKPFER